MFKKNIIVYLQSWGGGALPAPRPTGTVARTPLHIQVALES